MQIVRRRGAQVSVSGMIRNAPGPSIAAGCRCRNHGHADAATDHLANRIEIGQADAQFQAAPRAGRMVLHLILEGVARREADMVISKGITK